MLSATSGNGYYVYFGIYSVYSQLRPWYAPPMSDRTEYHREYARRRRANNPKRAKAESRKAYKALKMREQADPALREAREAKAVQWRKDHAQELAQLSRDWYAGAKADPVKLDRLRAARRRGVKRYRCKAANRLKDRARWALAAAVKRGLIVRGPCEICGESRSEGHHFAGYAWPLVVQWLCRAHHEAANHRV